MNTDQAITDMLSGGTDVATETRTGRSGNGNLRNFKMMSEDKFFDISSAIRAENNDPEAIAAVDAEYNRRMFKG